MRMLVRVFRSKRMWIAVTLGVAAIAVTPALAAGHADDSTAAGDQLIHRTATTSRGWSSVCGIDVVHQ